MTSSYSSSGLVVDRYADILARFIVLAEEKWGDSIDTSEDEFLGHLFRIVATVQAETNESLQSVYDAISVNGSSGVGLDNLMELIGIERTAAAYSTVTLSFTASKATTVPSGTQVKTSANVIFETDSAIVFAAAGSDDVTATCTEEGAYNAAAATVTTMVNSVYGISSVTNAAAATPGRSRETDAAEKRRHTTATSSTGTNSLAEIYEAVTAVSGVTSCSTVDNGDGTISVAVIGGAAADIGAAIADNLTEGITTSGSSSVDVYNETTGQTKTINYTVGADVPIHIAITTGTLSNYPADGDDQIRDALVALGAEYELGDNVIYNELFRPIYGVSGHVLSDLQVATSGPPSGTSDITMTAAQRATITAANIDITHS